MYKNFAKLRAISLSVPSVFSGLYDAPLCKLQTAFLSIFAQKNIDKPHRFYKKNTQGKLSVIKVVTINILTIKRNKRSQVIIKTTA